MPPRASFRRSGLATVPPHPSWGLQPRRLVFAKTAHQVVVVPPAAAALTDGLQLRLCVGRRNRHAAAADHPARAGAEAYASQYPPRQTLHAPHRSSASPPSPNLARGLYDSCPTEFEPKSEF